MKNDKTVKNLMTMPMHDDLLFKMDNERVLASTIGQVLENNDGGLVLCDHRLGNRQVYYFTETDKQRFLNSFDNYCLTTKDKPRK